MDKQNALTGIRKRQQIRTANKTVFAWIVGASVVVGICGVVSQFLVRELIFKDKIYSELSTTNDTLKKNIKAYDGLKSGVSKLVADENLTKLKKDDESTALQVVIDALPTEENRSALATSMQSEVLGPTQVSISSFSAVDNNGVSTGSANGVSGVGEMNFSFSINGSYDQVAQAIRNMELSIRPMNIKSFDIQGTESNFRASIQATTYYNHMQNIELKSKVVKP